MADARCLQVAVTRAARTRWQDGQCTLEEQDEFTAHILRGSGRRTGGEAFAGDMGARSTRRRPSTSTSCETGRNGGWCHVRWTKPRPERSSLSTATCNPTGGSRPAGWPTCSLRAAGRRCHSRRRHQAQLAGPRRRPSGRTARTRKLYGHLHPMLSVWAERDRAQKVLEVDRTRVIVGKFQPVPSPE